MTSKTIAVILLLTSVGCSTCDFVFDPMGPGKSYCYAKKACDDLCSNHGGQKKGYTISPYSFTCEDGTTFKGYKKEWREELK